MALGMTMLGSSCGGTVYPIAARQLIPLVGYVTLMKQFLWMDDLTHVLRSLGSLGRSASWASWSLRP